MASAPRSLQSPAPPPVAWHGSAHHQPFKLRFQGRQQRSHDPGGGPEPWSGLAPPFTSVAPGTQEALTGPHTQLQCPLTIPGVVAKAPLTPRLTARPRTGRASVAPASEPGRGWPGLSAEKSALREGGLALAYEKRQGRRQHLGGSPWPPGSGQHTVSSPMEHLPLSRPVGCVPPGSAG